MRRRLLCTLVPLTAAVALVLGGCPGGDDAQPATDGGQEAGPDAPADCPAGFLGDPSKDPVIEVRALRADGTDVPIEDGADLAILFPPQGGRVAFVGVRALNVDGCGIQVTGALRDLGSRQIRLDGRTVNLKKLADGWGTTGTGVTTNIEDSAAIGDYSNIPLCPNQWADVDVFDQPFELEVVVQDRRKKKVSKIVRVIPRCAESGERQTACRCLCKHGYQLGESCGEDAGTAEGGDPVKASLGLLGAIPCAMSIALLACSPSHTDPPLEEAGVDAGDAGDGAPATPEWTPVLEHLDGALLSIWGTSERDIWTVGGPLGNSGFDSLVMRFDGNVWTRATPGGTETYWWVNGTSASDVWLVGEKGRITHWDGTRFEERASGTTATLFGVWAAAPDDAWAVGGTPDQPASPNDVVLHWDGVSWKPEVLPQTKKVALFKVWGSSKDDLYVVGEAGVVWHRTAGAWKLEAAGVAKGRLTTVTGCSATEIIAVGGRDLLTSNGTDWKRADTLLVNDVNGVSCAPPNAPAREWGRAVIVGGGSLKLRLVNGAWQDDFGSKPFSDLHGAWVDPTGAFWGVGGAFTATARPGASREGVVARLGAGTVSSTIAK